MEVSVVYNDCNYMDIIWVPDSIQNLVRIQNEFFKWMFDKENNHKYWVNINNQKMYCSYGTEAFIEYLNEFLLKDSIEKAKILEYNSQKKEKINNKIYF